MANTKIPIELSSTPSIVDNGDATAITIDSSENVLIGTSSSSKNLRLQESFGIASTGALGGMAISGYSGTTAANRPLIDIQRSRGTSDESMTVVASGDYLGSLVFRGSDGTDFIDGAEISARVDGTPGTTDMPTNLTFHTQADGAGGAAAERMRIDSYGNVAIGATASQGDSYRLSVYGDVVTTWFETSSTTAGHEVMILNRKNSAGTMIAFAYNDAEKGSITQSGGTVSYNGFMGSHYSESSEDLSNTLLGTVVETVDALVENKYEDQKRLAKCKVSDTSESPNVYGVWIENNETGQVAALGASWCRINSSVTVSMGDLLVSNGDGTAKVQSDDIIRSKTIGKVTSTTVKETYSDGSYVVPVVLYCG